MESVMAVMIKKRILAVDDEPIVRILLSDALTQAGYEVDLAENGKIALQKVNSKEYDLIISDISMPELDGISLFLEIADHKPLLKNRFIFITGNITNELMEFFKENNCRYVLKPFNIYNLITSVSNIIEREVAEEPETSLVICSNCNKPFYIEATSERTSASCPHCGTYIQDIKIERRTEKRFPYRGFCRLFEDNSQAQPPFVASIEDVSRCGARVKGPVKFLVPGKTITLYIKEFNLLRGVEVKWSKDLNGMESIAGLQFTEPIVLPDTVTNP